MKRMNRLLIVAAALLASENLLQAQVTMTPLTSFGGGDGWLSPGEVAHLGISNNERGIAYGNNHLYLVSRTGGNFIRILDPLTGSDLGALNTTGIGGGTFLVNMIATGGDGAIYVGNLTGDASATPFTVYRWATEGATPTVVYSGTPLAGARVGDSFAAIGSGSFTRLAAGFGSNPMVPGNNGYAIIDPSAGTSSQVAFSTMPPHGGDFRLSVTFADAGHVLGSQGGALYRYTSFSGTTGTLLASPWLLSLQDRLLAYAIVGGRPLLAVMNTDTSDVLLYDATDPANPIGLTVGNNTVGPLLTNANSTGQLAWGAFSGHSARLYAMSTNQGIQAWTVTNAPIVVTTIADHDDGVCSVNDCTLREAINAANSVLSGVSLVFAPGLSGIIQLTGALPNLSRTMTIRGPGANILTIRRNTAAEHRIFTIQNASVTLEGLTISNGFLPANGELGGGIFNDGGVLQLTNCTLSGNHAYVGGGLYNGNGGTAKLVGCTLSGNTAFEGGAIDNFAIGGNATLTVSNSTVTGNSASSIGGGIGNGALGDVIASLTLTNCTLSGNSAKTGGGVTNGVFFGGTATVRVRNTIFKTGANGANLANEGGTITSEGNNRSNDSGGGFLVGPGDVNNVDPMLGPLQNNGGPTLTHALFTGSSAINNGNHALAPPVDQRGYLRAGTSDIGAFEFNGVAPTPPAATSVLSRKLHGGNPFDINLPLTGNPGVECRSGGAGGVFQIVLNFASAVTFSDATVTAGDAVVASASGTGTSSLTVNLSDVGNLQIINLRLTDVSDGTNTGDLYVPIAFLLGDTNGNRTVNATDIGQTKSQSGQPASASNFRSDVNASGSINASDIGQVKAQSGTQLPP